MPPKPTTPKTQQRGRSKSPAPTPTLKKRAASGGRKTATTPSAVPTASRRSTTNSAKKASKEATVVPSFVVSHPLFISSVFFCLVDLLGFLISIFSGSHLHLDLLGTGAFFVSTVSLMIMSNNFLSTPASSVPILLWSLRLASFLFYRATVLRHDARLNETLSTVSGTFGFWFVSALWGIFCTLPNRLAFTVRRPSGLAFSLCRAAGLLLFFSGFVVECWADYEKWNFKSAGGKGPMIGGIWSLCQHPNYSGKRRPKWHKDISNLCVWGGY